jgi:tRNA-specific 2-thiouridylase
MSKKVVVGMSGGVDSSVAAAILKNEGYDVTGITMQIWLARESSSFKTCCSIASIEEAKRVAEEIGIPHHTIDMRDIFIEKVIENFCNEYSSGRTPNPCIRCNQFVRFDTLLEKAKELGAELIATGHYARIERDRRQGRYLLKKGIDERKDQSYVLYVMTQDHLSNTIFPLGSLRKEETRKIAEDLNLSVATKPESQEICFIPEDDYSKFLSTIMPEKISPGPIFDKTGTILGKHQGLPFYTIGQRKGLGIAHRKPLYVISIDIDRNALIVGEEEAGYSKEFLVKDLNWVAVDHLDEAQKVKVKLRSTMKEADAVISLKNSYIYVKFDRPQWAITPGQSAVFYEGDVVLGGGIISL